VGENSASSESTGQILNWRSQIQNYARKRYVFVDAMIFLIIFVLTCFRKISSTLTILITLLKLVCIWVRNAEISTRLEDLCACGIGHQNVHFDKIYIGRPRPRPRPRLLIPPRPRPLRFPRPRPLPLFGRLKFVIFGWLPLD